VPPLSPNHHGHDREAATPYTWLGVETSSVPRVVSEQLGLAKGFGLVADYVVPNGPAAAAGLQQNDILKMLNDQILMEPGQLSKLIRSFPEGTSVTLTVLRKGADQKLTVKLAKHDVAAEGNMFGPRFEKHWESGHDRDHDTGMLGMDMSKLSELKNMDFSGLRDTIQNARREAHRAAEDMRRQARELHVVTKNNDGALRSTRIDLSKAQITLNDEQGEMRVESSNGKKLLTAKDPQGKLVFSGPVDSKEDLDKLPPDVRQRYEKLAQKDLPAATSAAQTKSDKDGDDNDNDADDDDDNDSDDADDNGSNDGSAGMTQVSFSTVPQPACAACFVQI
ncbi:MAG: PDZ domain-containing protein, partial [Verrucomicrobiota bacterium]|nr:PDZ domain-containing protein [Verrucomicrobiota bacterium]